MTTNPVESSLPRAASSVPVDGGTPGQVNTRLSPELTLTECMYPGDPIAAVFQRLAIGLATHAAEIASLMIYGSLRSRERIDHAMNQVLGEARWPVTWVECASCGGLPLAGVQAFAVSGRQLIRVRLGSRIVGSVYEDEGARHCLLGGLGPTALGLGPAAQVQQTFGNLEWALDQAGFELADVVRTWFYNDDILAWYPEFNRVRSAHYAGVKWRTGSLPASTGIGARNADRAALAVAAWAVKPLADGARSFEVGSPLQCPAPAYGSAFSRAMEIDSGGWRRLLVSGTASIFPDGKTAWVGDVKKQIDVTMSVVSAILQARGMEFQNVTRATAYFRHAADQPHFEAWLARRELTRLPIVSTHSVVCRDDLLFEIELDACLAVVETG